LLAILWLSPATRMTRIYLSVCLSIYLSIYQSICNVHKIRISQMWGVGSR